MEGSLVECKAKEGRVCDGAVIKELKTNNPSLQVQIYFSKLTPSASNRLVDRNKIDVFWDEVELCFFVILSKMYIYNVQGNNIQIKSTSKI
jgi:hypothetical protein